MLSLYVTALNPTRSASPVPLPKAGVHFSSAGSEVICSSRSARSACKPKRGTMAMSVKLKMIKHFPASWVEGQVGTLQICNWFWVIWEICSMLIVGT